MVAEERWREGKYWPSDKAARKESPLVSISRESCGRGHTQLPFPSPQFIHSFLLTNLHVSSPLSLSLSLSLSDPISLQFSRHNDEGEGQRQGDGEEEVSDRS